MTTDRWDDKVKEGQISRKSAGQAMQCHYASLQATHCAQIERRLARVEQGTLKQCVIAKRGPMIDAS
jgi:hypothetical protein